MRSGWRAAAECAALLVLLAGVFALHTWNNGRSQLAASEAALARGQLERAVRHARHAAGSYLPGAGHVGAAYARLQAIALDAEREANGELAASAWQAMRSAALESAHLWQPRAAQLDLANANLVRSSGLPSLSAAGLQERTLPGARRLLLGLGFLGAVGGLSWFCVCAWSEAGRWQLARAAWPALGWCAGALVLGWALLHA